MVRKLYVLLCMMLELHCASAAADARDRESIDSTTALEAVRAIFGYQEISPGKIRALDQSTVDRLGRYFSQRLRKKMERFVKLESAISRANTAEKQSVARSEADLIMTGDPLTNRFTKPDKIDISKPTGRDDSLLVVVTDIYKEDGKVKGRKSAAVKLVWRATYWVVDEIRFTSGAESKAIRLCDVLDDLVNRLNQ